MATLLPKPGKHIKGQPDHIDAWLMSYADLITLLFMFFVILASVAVTKYTNLNLPYAGQEGYEYDTPRSGLMTVGTPFDEMFRRLQGIVVARQADEGIAVEKTLRGVSIDISTLQFFQQGTATIDQEQIAVLKDLAQMLKAEAGANYIITIEGHTDDEPLNEGPYVNNWELSGMRAARVAGLLEAEGVNAASLRAVSYAGAKPLVPNKDVEGQPIAENRERNQRVVIKVELKS